MSQVILAELARIASAVEALAAATNTKAPNHRFPLDWFGRFDWSKIGAVVVHRDRGGAAVVMWNGFTFVRRAMNKAKFGKAIIFSRNSSDEESGYDTLVKFTEKMEIGIVPSDIAADAGIGQADPSAPVLSLLTPSKREAKESPSNGHAAATGVSTQPTRTTSQRSQPVQVQAEPEPTPEPVAAADNPQAELRAKVLGATNVVEFDRNVSMLFAQFGDDPKKVGALRLTLFPKMDNAFDVALVEPMLDAITAYTEARGRLDKLGVQILESHNQAKVEAIKTFRASMRAIEGRG